MCKAIFSSAVKNEIIVLIGVLAPSAHPSSYPTLVSSDMPTLVPSSTPSVSAFPTSAPTVDFPSDSPTISMEPSQNPSISLKPSVSAKPSLLPSALPSVAPSISKKPTRKPTKAPRPKRSARPTRLSQNKFRSEEPSNEPSISPTVFPSVQPTVIPTTLPSVTPTRLPSSIPSMIPSSTPSVSPTQKADIIIDASFNYIMTFSQYTAAITVDSGPMNSAIAEVFTTVVKESVTNEDQQTRGSYHHHHRKPGRNRLLSFIWQSFEYYSRDLSAEPIIQFESVFNEDFIDVVCPKDPNKPIQETSIEETCVVGTTIITVRGNDIEIIEDILISSVQNATGPRSTRFTDSLAEYDLLSTEFLSEGSFDSSINPTIMLLPNPRPAAIIEEESDNSFSNTEIGMLALGGALVSGLLFAIFMLARNNSKKRKLKETEEREIDNDVAVSPPYSMGIYGDALSKMSDKPLADLEKLGQNTEEQKSLLLAPTMPESMSKDEEMEDAIQKGDWTKVQRISSNISDKGNSVRPPSPLSYVGSDSTSSSLSEEERKKSRKLDELIDRGDWDAVASLASYVTVSSRDKSIARRSGGSSVGSKGSNLSIPLMGMAVTPNLDLSDDEMISTASSLSGDSRRSAGSGISRGSSKRSQKSLRAQVLSLLERGAPEELGNADDMIEAFEGNEDDLLDMLKKKVKEKEQFRATVIGYLEVSAPEELDNADAMIEAFTGSEGELLEVLQSMHERKVAEKQRLSNQISKSETATKENVKTPIVVSSVASPQYDSGINSSGPAADYENINQAIDAGDWAVVAARAATLANDDDGNETSTNYTDSSDNSTVSSVDR